MKVVNGPTSVLVGFVGAHVVNDFNVIVLPAFLPALNDEFGLSYLGLGVLSLAFTLLSGVFQPLVGSYADREGRHLWVLRAGFAVTAVGFLAIGVSPTYVLVAVASLLCGLGASTYHPQATTFLARTYPAEKGRVLGMHGWGGSVGHFVAPATAAVLITAFGWRPSIIVVLFPSVVVLALLPRLVTESEPNPGASVRGAFSGDLLLLAVTFGLLGMVLRGFLTFLPTLLVDEGSSLTKAGVITTLVLVVGAVAQPLGGARFDRQGGRPVFIAAAAGTCVSLALFAMTDGYVSLIFVAGVAFCAFSLFPVSLAMANQLAGAGQTGGAAGIVFGVTGLMTAAVPAGLGAIADATTLRRALAIQLVLAVAALALATRLRPPVPAPALAAS